MSLKFPHTWVAGDPIQLGNFKWISSSYTTRAKTLQTSVRDMSLLKIYSEFAKTENGDAQNTLGAESTLTPFGYGSGTSKPKPCSRSCSCDDGYRGWRSEADGKRLSLYIVCTVNYSAGRQPLLWSSIIAVKLRLRAASRRVTVTVSAVAMAREGTTSVGSNHGNGISFFRQVYKTVGVTEQRRHLTHFSRDCALHCKVAVQPDTSHLSGHLPGGPKTGSLCIFPNI